MFKSFRRAASRLAVFSLASTLVVSSLSSPSEAVDAPWTVDEVHYSLISPTAVTFDWKGSDKVVSYGLTTGYGTTATGVKPVPYPVDSPTGLFWEAKLTGLQAGKIYHYRIGSGPDATFQTAPATGDVEFIDIGDLGSVATRPWMAEVHQQILAEDPDFVMLGGDLAIANEDGVSAIHNFYNDIQTWSKSIPAQAIWGNHEYGAASSTAPAGTPRDSMANYKSRHDIPNPQTVPIDTATKNTAPGCDLVNSKNPCMGEDWGWFKAGAVCVITMPETWTGAFADWKIKADSIMAGCNADPNIQFIVTSAHRPAYSSQATNSWDTEIRAAVDALGDKYSPLKGGKYVMNVGHHVHSGEVFSAQHGVVHVTNGGGGQGIVPIPTTMASGSQLWVRHLEHLKFSVSAGKMTVKMVCGPQYKTVNDFVCNKGDTIWSTTFVAPGSTNSTTTSTTSTTAPSTTSSSTTSTTVAAAGSMTLNADADTTTRNGTTTAKGSDTTLSTCDSRCTETGERRAFARFPVTGIPTGARNVKAYLDLYTWNTNSATVKMSTAVGTINEASTVWTNQPAAGTQVASKTGLTVGYNTWDVSSAITGNGAITFVGTQTGSTRANFASRESATATQRPRLRISWDAPATTTTTAAPTTTTTAAPTTTEAPTTSIVTTTSTQAPTTTTTTIEEPATTTTIPTSTGTTTSTTEAPTTTTSIPPATTTSSTSTSTTAPATTTTTAPPVAAGSIAVNADADTTTRLGLSTPKGTDTILATCASNCTETGERRSFVRFPVSGIPTGARNVRATLDLYTWSANSATLNVYNTAGSINESSTIWTNQPTPGTLLASRTAVAAGYNSWDVSSGIVSNGTFTFVVTQPVGSTRLNFASRESATATQRPVLRISWDGSLPAETMSCPQYESPIAQPLTPDSRLTQLSGLAVSRNNPGVIWTHNDKGGGNQIFAVDSTRRVLSEVVLTNAEAVDREDIDMGPGPGGLDYVYAGDVGDNDSNRPYVSVYRFAEPSVSATQAEDSHQLTPDRFDIRYQVPGAADGTYQSVNVEAMAVDPTLGDIYLFQKSWNAKTGWIYKVPAASLVAGTTATAMPVIQITMSTTAVGAGATGADFSADRSALVIKNINEGFLWKIAPGADVAAMLTAAPTQPCSVPVSSGEAIAFEGQNLLTISEGVNKPIYRSRPVAGS